MQALRIRRIAGRLALHIRRNRLMQDQGKRIYCSNVEGLKRASGGFDARKTAEILDDVGALVDKDPGKRTLSAA
jgi:hypothetical protein